MISHLLKYFVHSFGFILLLSSTYGGEHNLCKIINQSINEKSINKTCQISNSCTNLTCDFDFEGLKFYTQTNLDSCQIEFHIYGPAILKEKKTTLNFQNVQKKIKIPLTKGFQTMYLNVQIEQQELFSLKSSVVVCGKSCIDLNLLKMPYCLACKSRTSRSVYTPEDLHIVKRKNSDCDLENILSCGNGGTCERVQNFMGVCRCMTDYEKNATTGLCERKSSSHPPSPQVAEENHSYSAAVGALISICILAMIAAGIFYGAKYDIITRIIHSPLSLRCCPRFRRFHHRDNVSLEIDDDDQPLSF